MRSASSASDDSNIIGSIGTLFLMLVLGYFMYHVISGEHGLLSLIDLSKKVDEANAKLDVVSANRLRLEHRVKLLRDDSLDLDMLDEQARRLLGYVGGDETVYINNN